MYIFQVRLFDIIFMFKMTDFIILLNKAKMPTRRKTAQAKPTGDGSEGEKIINQ